jgi:hypothetical protein
LFGRKFLGYRLPPFYTISSIPPNAGKYVGNYNYRHLGFLTRRADILLGISLGLTKNELIEILDYVSRVLSINIFAGEKGIPSVVKALFPPPRS